MTRYGPEEQPSSRRPCGSGEVHRETFEIDERAVPEGTFVSRAQEHARSLTSLQCFLPTRRAQAPPIAGLHAGKAEFRSRCRKIVATGFGELEKRRSHHDADRVTSDVLSARVAATIPKEPRHRVYRADLKALTEDVAGDARPPASLSSVLP